MCALNHLNACSVPSLMCRWMWRQTHSWQRLSQLILYRLSRSIKMASKWKNYLDPLRKLWNMLSVTIVSRQSDPPLFDNEIFRILHLKITGAVPHQSREKFQIKSQTMCLGPLWESPSFFSVLLNPVVCLVLFPRSLQFWAYWVPMISFDFSVQGSHWPICS